MVPPLDLNQQLGHRAEEKGSFYITRPVIRHYIADQDALKNRTQALFEYIANGKVEILIGDQYSLEESRKAHEVLEARRVIAQLILKID